MFVVRACHPVQAFQCGRGESNIHTIFRPSIGQTVPQTRHDSATKAHEMMIDLLTTHGAWPIPLREALCVKAVATVQGCGRAKEAREILSPLCQIWSHLFHANAAGLVESGQEAHKLVDRPLRCQPRGRCRIVVVVQEHDRRAEHEIRE